MWIQNAQYRYHTPPKTNISSGNSGWKDTFLLNWSLFTGHVNSQGGIIKIESVGTLRILNSQMTAFWTWNSTNPLPAIGDVFFVEASRMESYRTLLIPESFMSPCLAPVGKVNGALEEKGILSKKLQFLVFNDASVAGTLAPGHRVGMVGRWFTFTRDILYDIYMFSFKCIVYILSHKYTCIYTIDISHISTALLDELFINQETMHVAN